MQLSYLETIWFFWALVLGFTKWVRAVISLELIIPHFWGNTFFIYAPELWNFCSLARRNSHYCQVWKFQAFFSL